MMLAKSEVIDYALGMASVTATLRAAMERSGQTRYAIARATGIPESTLSRFAHGKALRGENIDKLARYLALELRPKANRKGR